MQSPFRREDGKANQALASERTNANREFAPGQPGIKLAEPGIIAKNLRASASAHDEHQKKIENDTSLCPSKCDKA
jgi:hypothetical protein